MSAIHFKSIKTFLDTHCVECGLENIAQNLVRKFDRDGEYFVCLNGHRQHFTETKTVETIDAE